MLTLPLYAQTILLDVDRNDEQKTNELGPNLRKFTHLVLHAGMLASADQPGAEIIYGSSVNIAAGIRKKYKVTNVYSVGLDIENQFTFYKLKQEKGKTPWSRIS